MFSTAHQNDIEAVDPADVLTLDTGMTLATSGTGSRGDIRVNLVNNGTIDVNDGRMDYRSDAKVLTNNNLIRVRDNGELDISHAALIVNDDGTITVEPGSTLTIGGSGEPSTIRGGTIDGGGAVDLTGGVTFDGIGLTLEDVVVTVGGLNSTTLNVIGDITNNATIRLNDLNTNQLARSQLEINGDVSIGGSGQIQFMSNLQNTILAANSADVLTIGAGQRVATLQSDDRGTITARIINQGTIDAVTGTITLSEQEKVNRNLMRARDGGLLDVQFISIDNTGGAITAESGSTVRLATGTIVSGQITGEGTLQIDGTSNLDGVTLNQSLTTIGTTNSATLRLLADTTNNSVITLNGFVSGGNRRSRLAMSGPIVLDGNGEVRFNTGELNEILEVSDSNGQLTLGADHSITASNGNVGTIEVAMINKGLIDVVGVDGNDDPSTIRFLSADKVNESLIRARDGASLMIQAISVDNTAGTITVDPTSSMALNTTTVIGGLINGGGTISVKSATFDGVGLTLDDVTVNVGDGVDSATLDLIGNVTNNGLIKLRGAVARGRVRRGDVRIVDQVTLDGAGELRFIDDRSNRIRKGTGTDHQLTIGAEQTITAPTAANGQIEVDIFNHGTIVIDGALTVATDRLVNEVDGYITGGGMLSIGNNDFINHGTVSPGNSPGTLTFNGQYEQSSTGRLVIEIGGSTEHDILVVSGAAVLDGALAVELVDGYVPDPMDSFSILTASSISGFFANAVPDAMGLATLDFGRVRSDVIYNANSVVLTNVVPEPSAILVLCTSMLAFIARRRHRLT